MAVLLPALLCFSAFAQDLEESEDLAIRETLIRLTRAINNKDAQSYSALVTDKFDLIWRSGTPVPKSNVLKAANPRFSLFVEMLRRTSEKTALVDGVYGEGRFSAVLVKREERWLVSALRMSKPTPAVRVDNTHVEHWLNGVKVVEAELDAAFESPIVLQHHHTEAWFRNVKIRRL
jgi:hypothetical protein